MSPTPAVASDALELQDCSPDAVKRRANQLRHDNITALFKELDFNELGLLDSTRAACYSIHEVQRILKYQEERRAASARADVHMPAAGSDFFPPGFFGDDSALPKHVQAIQEGWWNNDSSVMESLLQHGRSLAPLVCQIQICEKSDVCAVGTGFVCRDLPHCILTNSHVIHSVDRMLDATFVFRPVDRGTPTVLRGRNPNKPKVDDKKMRVGYRIVLKQDGQLAAESLAAVRRTPDLAVVQLDPSSKPAARLRAYIASACHHPTHPAVLPNLFTDFTPAGDASKWEGMSAGEILDTVFPRKPTNDTAPQDCDDHGNPLMRVSVAWCDLPTTAGASGSPVLNQKGQVVAMLFCGREVHMLEQTGVLKFNYYANRTLALIRLLSLDSLFLTNSPVIPNVFKQAWIAFKRKRLGIDKPILDLDFCPIQQLHSSRRLPTVINLIKAKQEAEEIERHLARMAANEFKAQSMASSSSSASSSGPVQ